MEVMIKMDNVKKTYGSKNAVDALSFKINKGEIFGLLGPSGSGKTTTIRMLTGETRTTSGHIEIMDFNETTIQKEQYRKQIGVLSDDSALYERLSVEDNLKMFAKIYNKDLSHIGRVLAFVKLENERKTLVKKLSKGMKQRILLAKALIHEPKLLFLDEPTSALDPNTTAHIHRGLMELKKNGTTIFLTTHNMQEAETLCDRVALINNGRLIALETPEQLKYQNSNKTIKVTLKDGAEFIFEQNAEDAKALYEMMQSGQIKHVHSDEPSLGEVFIKLTGKELV